MIVTAVAQQMEVKEKSIYTSARGRGSSNIPRWMALFLSREVGKHPLDEICQGVWNDAYIGCGSGNKKPEYGGR